MPGAHVIVRSVPIVRTARLLQCEGLFDVPPSERSEERWTVDFDLPDTWNVGVIVGPSGAGKTTVARELFGASLVSGWEWPEDKSILDGFPAEMSIKDIVALLSSVGFSSPPSWVRPFRVLSNGEQFRVSMARTLAEMPDLSTVDEFTSVVDRTVAQIGSAAIAKTVRRRAQKFIAVTCHYDILEWLEPDWVYEPHTNTLSRRLLQRPKIDLDIRRVHSSAWQLFRKHHYLSTHLHKAAQCFVAFWRDVPVAFTAVLPFPHPQIENCRREHRTVCLPDFQGVGIGNTMSDYVAALCRGMGWRYQSSTSHPGMIVSRSRSLNWKTMRGPSFSLQERKKGTIGGTRLTRQSSPWKGVPNRLTASFEYVGPALSADEARRVWGAAGLTCVRVD